MKTLHTLENKTNKQKKRFYLSNISFCVVVVVFNAKQRKHQLPREMNRKLLFSQLPGGQATYERQVHFIFSPAKQLLSFSWCQVLLSHLTRWFDCPENEQNNEPLA